MITRALSIAMLASLPVLASAAPMGATVWSDEFDGPAGTAPDSTNWTLETGGHGWGNEELEFYTDRRDNSRLDGEGHLIIEARKEAFKEREYTSARMITKGKFAHRYGRFEARIKLPKGQGIWSAFWIMGDNIDKAGWPGCGEVDILELLGHEPGKVYGTMHGPGYSDEGKIDPKDSHGIGSQWVLPDGGSFADDFHVFAVEWTPKSIRWFVDETCYQTRTIKDLHGAKWVFDRPFFFLLNVAVGGDWPGVPDVTTPFPQRMVVDYVRVLDLPKETKPAR
jgi:beta-glucanase (GH16 family)